MAKEQRARRGYKPLLKRIAIYLVIFYSALLLFGCFFADRLIFLPHRSSYQDTSEILKLPTSDGEKIAALYLPNPKAQFTVLYSHGNGEDLGDDRLLLHEYHQHGFSVFAYDYHGYGTSTGHPSERAAYTDINTAYEHLTKTLGVSPSKIIAHGRSLGAGLAVDLASRKPLAGLIIESGFVTAFRVRTGWRIVPMDEFRSIDKISSVPVPVLVMHGTADWVIRPWHGRELFARANEPKFSLWIEGAGHNDVSEIAGEKYWRAIQDFTRVLADQEQGVPSQ